MSKTTESFEEKKYKEWSVVFGKKNTFSQPPLHLPVCYVYTYPPGEDLNRLHLGGLGEAGVGSLQGSVSHFAGCIHTHGG